MADGGEVQQTSKAKPRFAMAGQIFGRRRTVFAAVPIAVIKPNPKQPRQYFDPEALAELAESIKARGLLQPVIVRRDDDGGYTLIAGERRLRAAELAGVGLVPAILSNHDLLEVALEENIQRQDLNALEEAEALAILASERGYSHAKLAGVIHKSRPYVSNTLTLTRLPQDIKREYLDQGAVVSREIMISVARQESPEEMHALWKRVKLGALSVRSFRQRAEAKKPFLPVVQVIKNTRKLGRAIRQLSGLGTLEEAQAATLRRSLLRARKAIDRVLSELPEQEKKANPRPRALVAVRG
ncbi:MAG: ParB/RepB/Spo0J family partition protein [Candidatus Binatia bacterium]|nr:ParB/RepB/Spo0J family partition protein [Candidatus Binatia bacterium]